METSYKELLRENDDLPMGPKGSEKAFRTHRERGEYPYPFSGKEPACSIFDQAVEPLVFWENTFGEVIKGLIDEGFRMREYLRRGVSQAVKPLILWIAAGRPKSNSPRPRGEIYKE